MLRKITITILTGLAICSLLVLALVWFSDPRESLEFDDPYNQKRALLEAKEYAVVSGTPWSTEAAVGVLERGGNAVDAAVAAVLMLNVTFGEAASFPGVAPVMLYDAKTKKVRSYVGAGTAPGKATIELFKKRGHDKVPDLHILSQLIPASPDVIVHLLKEYGTMSFADLVEPAVERARLGFPVHHTMAKNLNLSIVERLAFRILLPTSSEVYFGERWWLPLKEKDRFRRPMLAKTLESLASAEQEALAKGGTRNEGLDAVRAYFYSGPIAEAVSNFHKEENGLITYDDLANYESDWEQPLKGNYHEYDIYVNGTWTQGIVIPMVLQTLEKLDLKSLGHNSAEYVHTVAQGIELAMADRNAYVADQLFTTVPVEDLLDKTYANDRRGAMTGTSFRQMPKPGKIKGYGHVNLEHSMEKSDDFLSTGEMTALKAGDDTSQVVVIDQEGNAIAITPSDFPQSPMVPNTGLTLGIRMTQFSLDPNHANRLEPGKRPRITPHAAMVFKNGEFYMAFNTPGGDMQAQALVQVFLNHVVFGMDIQTAIDAPRFRSHNFPSSFDPDDYSPGVLALEASLTKEVLEALQSKGYKIERFPDWDNAFSAVGAIVQDSAKLFAGSDPRESGVAMGK